MCEQRCTECPDRFRCPEAFTSVGPKGCNLKTLIKDFAEVSKDLSNAAACKTETSNLVCYLEQISKIAQLIGKCTDELDFDCLL